MKTFVEYLVEAKAASMVKFHGDVLPEIKEQSYEMNKMYFSKEHHDLVYNAMIKKMNCDAINDLLKQGVKYVIAIPPHGSNGNVVDYYTIQCFSNRKKHVDMYKGSEKYVIYDVKAQKFLNDNHIMHSNIKVIRLD